MIEAYVSSWVSGALDKAAARMSVTFSLALHHIASFIFLGDKLSVRKNVARNLLLHSSRKPYHQVLFCFHFYYMYISWKLNVWERVEFCIDVNQWFQAKMSQLLQYNALDCFQEHNNFTSGQSLSREEIMRRSSFLLESCEGDSLLLAEVQKIQTAV